MTSLTAAHWDYEYQDLLVACRLVDILLGTPVSHRHWPNDLLGKLFEKVFIPTV